MAHAVLLPGQTCSAVGSGLVGGEPVLQRAVAGGLQDLGAHHKAEAHVFAENTLFGVGTGEEVESGRIGHGVEQLIVHLAVEQDEAVGLRNIVGVEDFLHGLDVGKHDFFAVAGGTVDVCRGVGAGGGHFHGRGGGYPVVEDVGAHGLKQGGFALRSDGRAFVVAQFHVFGLVQHYGCSVEHAHVVGQVVVGTRAHGGRERVEVLCYLRR